MGAALSVGGCRRRKDDPCHDGLRAIVSSGLREWWVQLWAESLGKNGKGAAPIAALGPVDQHSQLQLWLDGPRDKLFTVVTTGIAGHGPAHGTGACRKCGRTGPRRQDRRRPRRRAGACDRRYARQERPTGAHDPRRRAQRARARRADDAFHVGDDHRRASCLASIPSISRRSSRARFSPSGISRAANSGFRPMIRVNDHIVSTSARSTKASCALPGPAARTSTSFRPRCSFASM